MKRDLSGLQRHLWNSALKMSGEFKAVMFKPGSSTERNQVALEQLEQLSFFSTCLSRYLYARDTQ